jgi:glutamine cyclotransferase
MHKNRPTNKNHRWLISSLLLVVVIGAIITVWLIQNKPQNGSTPDNTPSQNELTITSTPTSEPTKVSSQEDPTPQTTPTPGSIPDILTSQMTYEVIQTYPHDSQAFTQGLVIHEGYFYESTGLYGQSSLRKVEINTGRVLQKSELPSEYFAEGLTIWEDKLIQLTWRENTGFVYDLEDFSPITQFNYPNEGWGLTHDGTHLIQSDGTATLSFLDPETYQVTERITVIDQGTEIDHLNELETIQGEIYANIWRTDYIVRIDPKTGIVLGWIDFSGILPEDLMTANTDVLNGIAYEPVSNRLFVTGKNWPTVFEIRLVSKP